MDNKTLDRLLRRTRRKLFLARWLTASITFYFYAFFIGTGLILTDRIGGELNLWNPFSLEWVILTTVIVTLLAGGLYGAVYGWRNRCSKREVAWMIDRRCDADALLVTALDADELEIDASWSSLIREQAGKLSQTYLRKNLFRLPGQGIRWMFLFALLLDLGLVLFLTPTYKPIRKQTTERQVKKGSGASSGSSGGGSGEAKAGKSEGSDAKEGENRKSDKDQENSSEQNQENNRNDSPRKDDPQMFGEEERREHERDPKVVKEQAEEGPTREGLVRMFESGGSANDGGGTSDNQNDDGTEPDPSRAEALHRQYQRQAERMIWRRSLSREERELVRRYFKEIRPESNGSEKPNDTQEQ